MTVDISSRSYYENKICLDARNGNLKGLQNTIENHGLNVNYCQDDFGRTPLSYAAEQNHFNVTEYLVNKGANLDIMDLDGRTLLFYPVIYGHFEMIKFLVGHGTDLSIKDQFGRTLISCASERGHLDVVKFLVGKGVDIDARDTIGRTPYSYAIEGGHSEVVQVLFQNTKRLTKTEMLKARFSNIW